MKKISESRSWLFEKTNKVEEYFNDTEQEKRDRTIINKNKHEREVTTDILQRVVRKYSEKL